MPSVIEARPQECLQTQSKVLVPAGAYPANKSETFDLLQAFRFGLLGASRPTVSESRVEGIACCTAMSAWN